MWVLIAGQQSPRSPEIPMGIPPMTRESRWGIRFFFQHKAILFFPPRERSLPYMRICWLLDEHQKRRHASERLRCFERAMERQKPLRLSIDVGKTPLMGNVPEMGSYSCHNGSFPIAHCSHGEMGSQKSSKNGEIPMHRFIGLTRNE